MTMVAGVCPDEVVHLIYASVNTPYLLSLFEKSANVFTLCNVPLLIQIFDRPKTPTCFHCITYANAAQYRWHEMVRDE